MNERSTLYWTAGWRHFTVTAIVAVASFVATKFVISLASAIARVWAVSPSTDIALVALLLLGRRTWPGVFLGTFVANAVSDVPLVTAAGIATGNTLASLAGAFMLHRFVKFDFAAESTKDVLGLLVAALLSTTVSASLGVATLALSGMLQWSSYTAVWWVWWVGDALGVLLFSPFLLGWAVKPGLRWRGWRLAEFLLLFVSLAGVSAVAFTGHSLHTVLSHRLEYAAFPFLVWAAFRFGQREVVSAALLVSGIAILGTVQDRGPFASGTLDDRFILLNTFVGVTGITALFLGAVTAERQRSQESLRQARDEQERRIQERTAELASANQTLLQLNETLNRRTQELSEKNEEVEGFVYIVSHDLRGPLVNLQGFSRELETSCTDLERHLRAAELPESVVANLEPILRNGIQGSLRYISASTTKFQRLIDALLQLSRSGRQVYRFEDLDVRAIVAATLDSLQQSIERSDATVHVGPLPAARGDATAIGQVLSNLIANAISYLKPGRPGVIEVGGTDSDGMALYWVRDNGAGIPASAHHRLFQVFQRFHPTLAAGDGMGLAFVKRAVERHGGKVWAESREGTGTTFYLTLPGIKRPQGVSHGAFSHSSHSCC